MADSTTDYNKLDPLGDEAAVVDEVDEMCIRDRDMGQLTGARAAV